MQAMTELVPLIRLDEPAAMEEEMSTRINRKEC